MTAVGVPFKAEIGGLSPLRWRYETLRWSQRSMWWSQRALSSTGHAERLRDSPSKTNNLNDIVYVHCFKGLRLQTRSCTTAHNALNLIHDIHVHVDVDVDGLV